MRIHMRTHMTIHMRTHMRAHMSTDDGDKQCIRINALFSKELMLFQQFCCALLVGISKFKHIYETELQLSTRFPFHCQDRFIFWFKWGSENEVEKSVEKVVPKGPQMDPKSIVKSTERVFWRGSKEGPKKGTLSRTRKSEILLLFTTL